MYGAHEQRPSLVLECFKCKDQPQIEDEEYFIDCWTSNKLREFIIVMNVFLYATNECDWN